MMKIKTVLKVLQINPCHKDNTVYRATLSLTAEVLNIIDKQLHFKLRFSFISCTVYPFKPHKRCFKCQAHGHMKYECKQATATCAVCAGDHFTDQCIVNDITKCINCFKSTEFKDGAFSHSANSNTCPIFRDYRKRSNYT